MRSRNWLFLCLGLWLCGLGLAQAATSVVAGTPYRQTSSNSALPLVSPAGTSVGDVLLAQLVGPSMATFTAPSGWTELTGVSVANYNYLQQRIYYRRAANSGTASYAFKAASNGNGYTAGVILSIKGASSTTPICGTGMQRGGGNTAIAPNVQTQPPNCPVGSQRLAFFATNNANVNLYLALQNGATAGPTTRIGSGTSGGGLFSSYYTMLTSDNGGQQSGTLSSNTDWIGATVIVNPGPVVLDHIQLEFTGTPLTCAPLVATVKACADAACSSLASSATTVTLSSSSGSWLGSNPVSFTGSTPSSLSVTSMGTTTVGASSSPAAGNATKCFLNGNQISSCQIGFSDSGLILSVPTLKSGETSSFTVSAVGKDPSSSACKPSFVNVAKTVKLWANYSNPSSGTLSTPLQINGSTATINAVSLASSASSTGTSFSLNFNSSGVATASLNYLDAGLMTLNARYDGSAATSDAGLVLKGSSDFVTVPYALCVDSPDANWGCAAADTTCAKFTSAGTAFKLRVTGKAYQANTATCSLPKTPNYIQSGLVLSSAVVAPKAAIGGVNGALSPATISISSGGTVTQATQTMSEVGVFTFTATPPSGTYFGQTVPPGTSDNSGRFVPAGFTVKNNIINDRSDINTTKLIGGAETCASDFTYLGEPVRSLFRLVAVDASPLGATTQNYIDSFARLNLLPVNVMGSSGLAFGAQDQAGTPLLNPNATSSLSRLSASCVTCGPFSAGVAQMAVDITVLRASGTTLDGPYPNARVGLVATDPDGVTMKSINSKSLDYNWDGDVPATDEGLLLGTTELRFGRMRVENAYGSALLALPVPAYAQYWNGTAFVKNTIDNCSQITVPTSQAASAYASKTLFCNGGIGLYGSLTGVVAGYPASLDKGDAKLVLSKPAANSSGYLDLVLNVPDYLKNKVDGVDQTSATCTAATPTADGFLHDDNPRARIRFGIRRNDGIIYMREVF